MARLAPIAIVLALFAVGGCQPPDGESTEATAAPEAEAATTDSTTCTSGEVPYDLASQTQAGADDFAWGSVLAYAAGGSPEWADWPSTDDTINCNQDSAPADGSCVDGRYVPAECSEHYTAGTLILDEVGKVDDDVLEATTRGLSSDPVLAANGTFLRYIIVTSPQTQQWILGAGLQKESTLTGLTSPVDFPCSTSGQDGTNMDSTILKLAWMDPAGFDASSYYTQDVLVYTPAYRNSTGEASCEPKTMALVGLHLLRKTETQPAWVWGTFEHAQNAPDCTSLPPGPHGQDPATSCPTTVSTEYNFYATSCQDDGTSGACQNCNVVPANNGAAGQCVNPNDQSEDPASWCLDQPPASTSGLSRLCRQIAPGNYYSGATTWQDTPPNQACRPSSGPWSNYVLISTQWANTDLGSGCPNVQDQIFDGNNVQHAKISPQVAGLDNRPYLGNTSMESYERPNCMGCHSKSTVDENGTVTTNGTDFVYFLGLEVPGFEAADDSSSE